MTRVSRFNFAFPTGEQIIYTKRIATKWHWNYCISLLFSLYFYVVVIQYILHIYLFILHTVRFCYSFFVVPYLFGREFSYFCKIFKRNRRKRTAKNAPWKWFDSFLRFLCVSLYFREANILYLYENISHNLFNFFLSSPLLFLLLLPLLLLLLLLLFTLLFDFFPMEREKRHLKT